MRTNWSEISYKECFFPVLDARWHELVCYENRGDSAKDEDQEAKSDEPWNCKTHGVGLMKIDERHDDSNVREASKVEKNVHARVDFIVKGFGFGEILAIPVKSIACQETGKQVIGSDSTTGTNKKELLNMGKNL